MSRECIHSLCCDAGLDLTTLRFDSPPNITIIPTISACRFKRATFTLEALSPAQLAADTCNEVQKVDKQLLERQAEVSRFEGEFRKVMGSLLQHLLETRHASNRSPCTVVCYEAGGV